MADSGSIRAGGAYVEIGGDNTELDKKLGNSKESLKSWGKEMAKIGAGLAAIGGAIKLAANECLSLFGIQEKAEAQLEAVIRSTQGAARVSADEAKRLAAGLQQVTAYGDEAIIGGQNLLLTFTSIGRDIFPLATETMLDMSEALGQDLKSSAIQLGKALQDPITGTIALRRVGVAFTKEQMEQIKTLVESGNKLAAQRLILRELSTEFGGSARAAANTYTGSVQRLKNALGDLREAIGAALAPMAQAKNELRKGWAEMATDWVNRNQYIVVSIYKIGKYLLWAGAVFGAVGAFILAVCSPIVWAVGLITFGVLALAGTMSKDVGDGVSDMTSSIKLGSMTIRGWWDWLIQWMTTAWYSMMAGVDKVFLAVLKKLKNGIDWITESIIGLLNLVGIVSDQDVGRYKAEKERGNGVGDRLVRGAFNAQKEHQSMANASREAQHQVEAEDQRRWEQYKNRFKLRVPQLPRLARPFLDMGDMQAEAKPKMAVTGFMGNLRLGEQIGAAYASSPADRMVEQQRTTNQLLREIRDKQASPAYA
jgi:hypothetical protein